MIRPPPRSTRTDTLFPDTTLFRSTGVEDGPGLPPASCEAPRHERHPAIEHVGYRPFPHLEILAVAVGGQTARAVIEMPGVVHRQSAHEDCAISQRQGGIEDRKSTRLNSSH